MQRPRRAGTIERVTVRRSTDESDECTERVDVTAGAGAGAGPGVVLVPAELLSKWGFDDGDLLNEPLERWVSRSPWAARFSEGRWVGNAYFWSGRLLDRTVRRHLVPSLPEDIRPLIRNLMTSHNQIVVRPASRPGLDDDAFDIEMNRLERRLGLLAAVSVTQQEIDALCEELYPQRTDGWLALFDVLYLPAHSPTLFDKYAHELPWDVSVSLVPYVDGLAARFNDDELRLAADLLRHSPPRDLDRARIEAALDAARRVLR